MKRTGDRKIFRPLDDGTFSGGNYCVAYFWTILGIRTPEYM